MNLPSIEEDEYDLSFYIKGLYLHVQFLCTHDARGWITDILVFVGVHSSLFVCCFTVAVSSAGFIQNELNIKDLNLSTHDA